MVGYDGGWLKLKVDKLNGESADHAIVYAAWVYKPTENMLLTTYRYGFGFQK
jgi:hypothetical protein